ncbi:MAG: DUF1573 domain-containing protein [Bacteroidetes bacterium]|nr:MAG: DUF1573 domain-containing protein [Bacteroidota bacterium]
MKKSCIFQGIISLLISIISMLASPMLFAAPGDTIIVQTVTFDDTLQLGAETYVYPPPRGEFHKTQNNYYQGGTYLFPPDTFRFEKILMYFTLKCDSKNFPACGEWDIIAFIYAYKDSNRFELGRFETPFGYGVNLGNGFTWIYDVSDFRSILKDSVTIKYVVPQQGQTRYELLDLKFMMIEGTPPRDVINIEKLWYGGFRIGDNLDPVDSHLQPIRVSLLPNVKTTKIRATIAGDGWGGSTGCAEFCAKEHWIDVNGTKRFDWYVWDDKCDMNPLYPQGGTWLHARSNRCPGAQMETKEFELTPFVNDSVVTLDYNIEPYTYPEDGEFWPLYTIETQLVSYGPYNFKLDASVENIIAPNPWQFYNRSNPICSKPSIILKNNGSDNLSSLDIDYGVETLSNNTYKWSGNLKFGEKDTVELPPIDFGNQDIMAFYAEVKSPNGVADEYQLNNRMTTTTKLVPYYFNDLILKYQTNNYPENRFSYTIKDINDSTIYYKNDIQPSTLYNDTFHLKDGCYELRFINEIGFGIDYWLLKQQKYTSGWIKLSNLYRDIKLFTGEFGREIFHQFTVGPKPMIVTNLDTLDFGKVKLNEQKELTFEISPGNNQSLQITNVNVVFGINRGYLATTDPPIYNEPVILKSGEKMIITVRFTPKKEGSSVTNLVINCNDERLLDKVIKLIGIGVDPNSIEDNNNIEPPLELVVQPNPVHEKAEIIFTGSTGNFYNNTKLTLINPLGQELKVLFDGRADAIFNKINFTTDGIAKGIYYLNLKSDNNATTIPIVVF